jgi:hypothetical protein
VLSMLPKSSAFYNAQGGLVLFPIGAYVKVDFKLGALKQNDGVNPQKNTLVRAKSTALIRVGSQLLTGVLFVGYEGSTRASGGKLGGWEIFGTKRAHSEEANEPNKRPKVI